MWSDNKNFNGTILWNYYLIRLILNIATFILLILFYLIFGYFSILFNLTEPLDEFICSV